MNKLHKWLMVSALIMGCLAFQSRGQTPAVSSPGADADDETLYVFGPRGNPSQGAAGTVQVVFFRVPVASAGSITLYVYDPASGSDRETGGSFLGVFGGRPITTVFTVYGGKGAFTAPESRQARPAAAQPGTALATLTAVDENANQWVALGTFSRDQMEVVGDQAFLKLVAVGTKGNSANYFRVGSSVANTDMFVYGLSLHLSTAPQSEMLFDVEVPVNVAKLTERNFDVENGGTLYLGGQELDSAASGHWTANEVAIKASSAVQRLPYRIVKGTQASANGTIYVVDDKGNALPLFLRPGTPTAVAVPPPVLAGDKIETSLVRLVKSAPARASVNDDFTMRLQVTAKQSVRNVQVTDTLPAGTELVSSEPQAQRNGQTLVWQFETMAPGETRDIVLVLRTANVGQYVNCATISAEPLVCAVTVVGKPELTIVKTGPKQIQLDAMATYEITVTNVGTAVANDVVLVDTVPDGMVHSSGQTSLRYELGNLAPGQSRSQQVVLKGVKRGESCNQASANGGNVPQVAATACTTIVKPMLEITKSGLDRQFLGKTAGYEIIVRNPGDVDLHNVVVTDTAPAETSIVSAKDAEVKGNTAIWRIATLPAGHQITGLEVVLTSRTAGTHTNRVTASVDEGLSAADDAPTLWIGYPALLLEVVDSEDALLPGQETVYTITITNQGTAPDTNVAIVVTFPEQIVPTGGEGSTKLTIVGNKATAAPAPSLAPRGVLTWKITTKAAKVGDARILTEMTSDLLKTPVKEEESTQVY